MIPIVMGPADDDDDDDVAELPQAARPMVAMAATVTASDCLPNLGLRALPDHLSHGILHSP